MFYVLNPTKKVEYLKVDQVLVNKFFFFREEGGKLNVHKNCSLGEDRQKSRPFKKL